VEAKGVEGTLMDTVFGDLYTYKACPTVVSLEVTEAPGFEETLMDTVFGVSYTYDACPTVVSLEVPVINVSFLEGIGFRFWGDSVGIPAVSFASTVSQMITVNENDSILQKNNAHAIPIQSLHSWYNLFERQQCYCWRN
jgi:hypothetical protein